MSLWGIYWLGFVVVGFGVAELVAIRRNDRGETDTLSDHVWWIRSRIGRVATALILAPFLAWLFVHFVWGGS